MEYFIPSHLDCSKEGKGKNEPVFCFETVGKSKCVTKQKGCLCGAYPVKQSRGFKNFYFCIKGSEDRQNKK